MDDRRKGVGIGNSLSVSQELLNLFPKSARMQGGLETVTAEITVIHAQFGQSSNPRIGFGSNCRVAKG